MDKKEEYFRKLLKEVEKQYFEECKESNIDIKKIVPFVNEMQTTDLVGDKLVWLNWNY